MAWPYTYAWQKYRKEFIKNNPVCSVAGCTMPTHAVDHKTPHKLDMELFWDENNHQARCKTHHDRKTAKFDGGFSNPIKKETEKDVSSACDSMGFPVDPNHEWNK